MIFRAAHSIKGNASLLDLKFLVEQAHEFEELTVTLREKKNQIAWDDFLPLAVEMSKLEGVFARLKEIMHRIGTFQAARKGTEHSSIGLLPSATEKLVTRLAEEQGKKIRFDSTAFEPSHIANRYSYILRDIIVQLTRNSVTHGIESQSDRTAKRKSDVGLITISTEKKSGQHILRYRDDGQGFQIDAIKAKAIEMGKVAKADIDSWDTQKILKLIFESGFSTAKETTVNAGRGMGMDIIRQRIKSVQGEMKMSFQPGEYAAFTFFLPEVIA